MDLKFACADFTFPLLKHDDVLTLIAMLGFDGVDVGMFEERSHLQPSNQFNNIYQNGKMLKEKLDEKGLKPADIFLQTASDFSEFAVNHPEVARRGKARNMFLQCLEYTVSCGGSHMSALPGVYFEEESKEKSFERCCEELSWRCEKAKDAGIVFSVEAHIGSIVPTPEEALVLVETVKGLTFTLDYTHFTRMGIPDNRVEPLTKHASHFHARGAAPGKLQTILSENTIDYASIIKVMKETDYKGYIGIEYTWQEWENCNRVDNISETIILKENIKKYYKG